MSGSHSITPVSFQLPPSRLQLVTICANCKEPTFQACRACEDAPSDCAAGQVERTYYCNYVCERADRTKHQHLCKGRQLRKKLYRAGDILQNAFYKYREVLFDLPVSRVENKDGKLYIHTADFEALRKQGHVILHVRAFPEDLVECLEDRRAVLAYLACSKAVSCMHDLAKALLSEFSSNISEVTFTVKGTRRSLVSISPGGGLLPNIPHSIFKVTLKQGGGNFAIDLSSAQYGYYEPVIPWRDYYQQRVGTGAGSPRQYKFGSHKDVYARGGTMPGYLGAGVRLDVSALHIMQSVFEKSILSHRTPSTILKLSQPEFEKFQGTFITALEDGLRIKRDSRAEADVEKVLSREEEDNFLSHVTAEMERFGLNAR